jgi:predicted outer membrane repeat protein
MANNQSNPILTSCTFFKNKAGYYGGAIYSNGKPEITNCIISENSAINGGGLNGCDGPISNSMMVRNHASGGGGLSFCKGPITNCIVSDNTSMDWAGGLLHCDGPVTNCIITGNKSDGLFGCDGSIANCTIVGNMGSALFACRGSITNCIIWDNSDIQIEHSAQPTYSNIQGGWPGEGNIDIDPCFVQPGYWDANGVWVDGNYHLLPGSPCIDAGDPYYIAGPNETDLDGKPRVIGGRIDMGAYEYIPPIQADSRIVPRTINLTSSGKWITAFLRLPENYNVADIDPNSVFLEDEIKPEQFSVDEQSQVATARFAREDVLPILEPGDINLKISGQLTDGTTFEATDIIKVTDKAAGKSAM